MFISDRSIIPIYDIEERDINKFQKLIETSLYIQVIKQTHESKLKGKYFLTTTNTEYKKVLIEATEIVNYIYPQIYTTYLNSSSQRSNIPTIHTNVSISTQTFIYFHEFHPVPENSSHKRIK